MDFSSLEKQGHIIKLLQNSYKKNRLVHLYLFEGDKGTPKRDMALYLAMMLLCQNENGEKPCKKCKDCKNVMKETHPSLFIVKKETEVIKKEQIENLQHEFSLTPLAGEKRVFIIEDIDCVNARSGNMLLKFLEELGPNNYGILTSENLNKVMPTIISRSEVVKFNPMGFNEIVRELMLSNITKEKSKAIATLTKGLDDAMLLSKDPMLDTIIDFVKKIGANSLSKERNLVLILNDEGKFLFTIKEKKYHEMFIDLLITFSNDKLFYTINQLDRIVFEETLEMLSIFVNVNYQKVTEEIEMLLEYKNRIKYNVNIELMYTEMLLEMMR